MEVGRDAGTDGIGMQAGMRAVEVGRDAVRDAGSGSEQGFGQWRQVGMGQWMRAEMGMDAGSGNVQWMQAGIWAVDAGGESKQG